MEEPRYYKRARNRFIVSLMLAALSAGLLIWRVYISPMYIRMPYLLSMMIDLIGILFLSVSQGGCMLERSTEPLVKDRFSSLLLSVELGWFMDMITWAVDENPETLYVTASYAANTFYYLSNIYSINLFARYLVAAVKLHGRRIRLMLAAMQYWFCAMAVLGVVNFFVPILFSVQNGVYQRELLADMIFAVDGLFLLLTVCFVFSSRIDQVSRIAIVTYVMLPFIGIALQTFIYGFSFITLSTVVSMFILYVHLYVHQGYVMEQQRRELLRNQTAVMLSQIQPHFLFNSLSTIIALCDLDPQLAKKTTEDFSLYLEHNLHALSDAQLIPFEKELEQVEAYLRIEKARFGDLLKVKYELPVRNFRLPSLTVQPIVENAIKHGIHDKPEGGTVRISTAEGEEEWIVYVEDDGVGFDATRGNRKGGFGVGIDNVRKRLKTMCGGSLVIKSEVGSGTRVGIHIPKEL